MIRTPLPQHGRGAGVGASQSRSDACLHGGFPVSHRPSRKPMIKTAMLEIWMLARYRRFLPLWVTARVGLIVIGTMLAIRLLPNGSLIPGRPLRLHDTFYLGGMVGIA